ncbi:MAG: cell division protein FtsI, partial [Propionibacterium sp.]
MNSAIRKVAVFVTIMFALLMANVTYNAVARAPGLLADNRNKRVVDDEYSHDRGAIMVGNTPIAQTKVAKTGFKYQRVYPKGKLYGHITGYYSYLYSRSGIEDSYNAPLAGNDSSQFFTRFVDILSGRKPSGANVQTSIDTRAQQAAAKALGNRKGAVIAMDYTTGEILALYSSPSYNPNLLAAPKITDQEAAWQKLTTAKGAPLKNRATTEVFLPGSTFKLVTAAAALESGIHPDSLIESPDELKLPKSSHVISNA